MAPHYNSTSPSVPSPPFPYNSCYSSYLVVCCEYSGLLWLCFLHISTLSEHIDGHPKWNRAQLCCFYFRLLTLSMECSHGQQLLFLHSLFGITENKWRESRLLRFVVETVLSFLSMKEWSFNRYFVMLSLVHAIKGVANGLWRDQGLSKLSLKFMSLAVLFFKRSECLAVSNFCKAVLGSKSRSRYPKTSQRLGLAEKNAGLAVLHVRFATPFKGCGPSEQINGIHKFSLHCKQTEPLVHSVTHTAAP